MTWKKISRILALTTVGITVLAHILFVTSLVGFRLRSDGWILHPVGVTWYTLFILGSLLLLVHAARKREVQFGLLIIPPILTLATVGIFPVTAIMGGARYAPFDTGDIHEVFVGMNLAGAFALVALTLLYRRPRLLLSWAVAQGLLLVTYPLWWGQLWRWGGLGNSPLATALVFGLPLLYALTLGCLGVRLPPHWRRRVVGGVVVGVILTLLAVLRYTRYLDTFNTGAQTQMGWEFLLHAPLLLLFGGLLGPLPLLAGEMLVAEQADQHPRFPWEVLVGLLLVATSVAIGFIQTSPQGMLPSGGDVQGWRDASYVVPNAWPPTLMGSGWLLRAARWLLIPYALSNVARTLQDRGGPRVSLRTRLEKLLAFPEVLLITGLLWVAALAWNSSRLGLPLYLVRHRPITPYVSPVIVGSLILLWAARALKNVDRTWQRWTWRGLAAMGLLGLVIWTGRNAWRYGRVLIAPLMAWTQDPQWRFAPLPRIPLAGLGFSVHAALLGLGLFALARWIGSMQSTQRTEQTRPSPWPVVIPLLGAVALVGLGWWLSTPRVVETRPQPGAVGVPRDISVAIEMQPRTLLWGVLDRSGFGISAHYADTGAYIPGTSGGSTSSLHFRPEAPLRVGAPVEVTVHRPGERPYTLQFATTTEP